MRRTMPRRRSHLEIPDTAGRDDDHLDAWVAWKMADQFLRGKADWLGSPAAGGYVVSTS
jgi:hypothetical protein